MMIFGRVKNKCCMVASRRLTKVLLWLNHVRFGSNCTFNGLLTVVGDVSIGNDVRINFGKQYNLIGGATRTILRAVKGGCIKIGDGCGISNSAIVSMTSVELKKNVLLGGNVKIYDTDFHSLDAEERRDNIGHGKTEPVLIKEGAFIGAHSIILKGVTVGKNSIVGAGSVVTKSIPDYEIWAGNPARFIRRINSSDVNDIQADTR